MRNDRFTQVGRALNPAITEQTLKAAQREIFNYSIAIATQEFRASGTLVNVEGAWGILTAHHVSKPIFKQADEVLISVARHCHRLAIPLSHLEHIVIGEYSGPSEETGPDLAFLRILNPGHVATLQSLKSFYHLGAKDKDIFEFEAHFSDINWFTAGVSQEHEEAVGPEIIKTSHFIGYARFLSLEERNGFDYVKLEASSGEFGYPSNFEGISGGGVWLVPLVDDGYHAPLLAGVAFYQYNPVKRQRLITCHGPRSIYDRLRKAILASSKI